MVSHVRIGARRLLVYLCAAPNLAAAGTVSWSIQHFNDGDCATAPINTTDHSATIGECQPYWGSPPGEIFFCQPSCSHTSLTIQLFEDHACSTPVPLCVARKRSYIQSQGQAYWTQLLRQGLTWDFDPANSGGTIFFDDVHFSNCTMDCSFGCPESSCSVSHAASAS